MQLYGHLMSHRADSLIILMSRICQQNIKKLGTKIRPRLFSKAVVRHKITQLSAGKSLHEFSLQGISYKDINQSLWGS